MAAMQEAMRESSRIVLNGFELGTDAIVVRHPDRYMDERGTVMWRRVTGLLDGIEPSRAGVAAPTTVGCPIDNTLECTRNSSRVVKIAEIEGPPAHSGRTRGGDRGLTPTVGCCG